MESNTNNISSAGLHGLDQRVRRSETSEEVDIRQGQNALGSLSLSTGLTPVPLIPLFHSYYFNVYFVYMSLCVVPILYCYVKSDSMNRSICLCIDC